MPTGSARTQRVERRLLANLQDDQAELRHFLAHSDAPQATQAESTSNDLGFSRGIVICAGGETLLANVYVSVKVCAANSMPLEQGSGSLDSLCSTC